MSIRFILSLIAVFSISSSIQSFPVHFVRYVNPITGHCIDGIGDIHFVQNEAICPLEARLLETLKKLDERNNHPIDIYWEFNSTWSPDVAREIEHYEFILHGALHIQESLKNCKYYAADERGPICQSFFRTLAVKAAEKMTQSSGASQEMTQSQYTLQDLIKEIEQKNLGFKFHPCIWGYVKDWLSKWNTFKDLFLNDKKTLSINEFLEKKTLDELDFFYPQSVEIIGKKFADIHFLNRALSSMHHSLLVIGRDHLSNIEFQLPRIGYKKCFEISHQIPQHEIDQVVNEDLTINPTFEIFNLEKFNVDWDLLLENPLDSLKKAEIKNI